MSSDEFLMKPLALGFAPISLIYLCYVPIYIRIEKTITIAAILALYSISFLVYGSSSTATRSLAAYAQSDLPAIKSRDIYGRDLNCVKRY